MAKQTKTDYNKLNSELDNIMDELQSGRADIDKSMALYQRGMEIINELQNYLKETENNVAKLTSRWKKK